MDRKRQAFLEGFSRAAKLARSIQLSPPRHTTAVQYLRDVASLHARSDDLESRGFAVGCLAALGSE